MSGHMHKFVRRGSITFVVFDAVCFIDFGTKKRVGFNNNCDKKFITALPKNQ